MIETTPIVTVTLARSWGPYAAGESVEVDAIRAGTLDELGYLERPQEAPAPKPRRRKAAE